MSTFFYRGQGLDPYENLAVEQALLERAGQDDCILYLWQNERTVVIGKNQNPWKECRLPLLLQDGGRLARRLSGGGAVYHDRGNLNVSFLAGSGVYDVARQTDVLLQALRSLGVSAERTGRNDLLADGRKFSGHAYRRLKDRACHHATLMVDVDTALAQRYLSPPKAKLSANGVDSVRSRVVNLRQLVPTLTCERLSEAICAAFAASYGTPELLAARALPAAEIQRLAARNASADWLYGERFAVSAACEGRFGWGSVELCLRVERGRVTACRVYTDAMDQTLAERVEAALTGTAFTPEAAAAALACIEVRQDLLELLRTCY